MRFKRFMAVLFSAVLITSMTACGSGNGGAASTESESVMLQPDGLPYTEAEPDDKSVGDLTAEVLEDILAYVPRTDGSGLKQEFGSTEKVTFQEVANLLAEYGVLPEGTEVLSFTVAEGVGTLDLSSISEGSISEKLVLASIGNTFIENFSAESIILKVDGNIYEGKDVKLDGGKLEFESKYKNMQ